MIDDCKLILQNSCLIQPLLHFCLVECLSHQTTFTNHNSLIASDHLAPVACPTLLLLSAYLHLPYHSCSVGHVHMCSIGSPTTAVLWVMSTCAALAPLPQLFCGSCPHVQHWLPYHSCSVGMSTCAALAPLPQLFCGSCPHL